VVRVLRPCRPGIVAGEEDKEHEVHPVGYSTYTGDG
jgi:hypothetical protein